mgnify:CR=1 FL=1
MGAKVKDKGVFLNDKMFDKKSSLNWINAKLTI